MTDIGVTAGQTFGWRGQELRYLDHEYNTTILNERAVEVPIANAWAQANEMMDPDFLEVGNVMSHYGWSGHRVVDLYEQAEGVENIDVFEVQGQYDLILCISTLEHVGFEHGATKRGIAALEYLRGRLLRVGSEMLITIPFGQSPYLDCYILDGLARADREGTMVRDWETGLWEYRDGERIWAPSRERGWANCVWVATWGGE